MRSLPARLEPAGDCPLRAQDPRSAIPRKFSSLPGNKRVGRPVSGSGCADARAGVAGAVFACFREARKRSFQLAWIRRLRISFKGSALFSVLLDKCFALSFRASMHGFLSHHLILLRRLRIVRACLNAFNSAFASASFSPWLARSRCSIPQVSSLYQSRFRGNTMCSFKPMA